MKISLKSTNSTDEFEATNENGHRIRLTGDDSGVGLMNAVLMATAACSSIDMVHILKKMRQDLQHIEVEATSTRKEAHPRTFTSIHMHYKLHGNIKEEKAQQAMDLSLEKYCSVSKMLEAVATISGSLEIIPSSKAKNKFSESSNNN